MKTPTPIEFKYNEPTPAQSAPIIRAETIFGMIPQVSVVPTWIPKTLVQSFAFYTSGATRRLYVYDFVGTTWRYSALT